jgi:KDO2-lipid IV(A) lauroyltransferase
MQIIGPFLSRNLIGRRNLALSFPEKTSTEREKMLSEAWANLGRVGAEFVFLERWARRYLEDSSWIAFDEVTAERFLQLRYDGVGALLFSAHFGNWELPAIVANASGLQTAVLYRAPSVSSVAQVIREIRTRTMGEMIPASLHAPFALARALREGKHVGMMVDQHDSRGVPVTFFGQRCRTSPLIALLARECDVPIHGVYALRLADGRFKVELTQRLMPIVKSTGEIDISATMQLITSEVESWIRRSPEQWLWVHQRWKDDEAIPERTPPRQ